MADAKISALPAATSVADADLFAIVQGGVTMKATGSMTVKVYAVASGDPNGVVTATRPAILYTDAGGLWVKTGVGSSNTGWINLIAE